MIKVLGLLYIFFMLTFNHVAWAQEVRLQDRVITDGPNAGLSLMEAVTKAEVPEVAAQAAFQFFDKYELTHRTYKFLKLYHFKSLPPEALGFSDKPNDFDETTEETIANKNYMVIFDLNLHSLKNRLHVIDLNTGIVDSVPAAHGWGTDCGGNRIGYACRFVSHRESDASPLGFFSTGALYTGPHGTSIRLNGLEARSPGFPGNTFPSTIIIHPADYVYPGNTGRSNGCPAMNVDVLEKLKDKLAGGILFYFYHSSLNYQDRNPIVENLLEK
jgi:hypothetical protein